MWLIWIFCSRLCKFYFRWLENSVIGIGKAASITLMFNHLKWNPSKIKTTFKKIFHRWSVKTLAIALRKVFKLMLAWWRCQPITFKPGKYCPIREHQFETPSQFAMREPILFGDYRNTLIANEPRLYEDIQDFDASKGPGFKA